jgi:selenium metabolism protein YedF
MSKEVVNAQGLVCPKPLIMTKKALGKIAEGEAFTLLIDNATSKQNVERFLTDNGARCESVEKDGVFTLTVTKGARELSSPDAAAYCTAPPPRPHVIAFKRDKMGFGSEELGEILAKACINTILEVEPLPSTIVFYNSGIHLALQGSPVVETLKNLESRGVKILVCGTCVDYYGKKDQVAVGIVSNMYDILETLTAAGHVVTP